MTRRTIRGFPIPSQLADRLAVSYPGVDTEAFSPWGDHHPELARIVRQGPVFFHSGRLCQEKGQLDLVEALPLISQKVPGTQVVLCDLLGDAAADPAAIAYRNEILARARDLGLHDRVHLIEVPFESAPSALRTIRGNGVVAATPRYPEWFGMVVPEAQIVGVPVVVYPVGAFSETVVHGQTGLICETSTVGELAAAATVLLSDSALRDSVVEQARETALRKYSLSETTASLVTLYETSRRSV